MYVTSRSRFYCATLRDRDSFFHAFCQHPITLLSRQSCVDGASFSGFFFAFLSLSSLISVDAVLHSLDTSFLSGATSLFFPLSKPRLSTRDLEAVTNPLSLPSSTLSAPLLSSLLYSPPSYSRSGVNFIHSRLRARAHARSLPKPLSHLSHIFYLASSLPAIAQKKLLD